MRVNNARNIVLKIFMGKSFRNVVRKECNMIRRVQIIKRISEEGVRKEKIRKSRQSPQEWSADL